MCVHVASFELSELSFLRRLIQNECWSDICKCHQLSKWTLCAGLGDDRSAPRQDVDWPHHADELIHACLQPEEAEREAEVGVDGAAAAGHRGTSCVYDLTDHHHGPRPHTANVMWPPPPLKSSTLRWFTLINSSKNTLTLLFTEYLPVNYLLSTLGFCSLLPLLSLDVTTEAFAEVLLLKQSAVTIETLKRPKFQS